MREAIAIGICMASAAFGAIAIYRGWANVSSLAIGVGGIWSITASWLGRHFNRREWKRLHGPLSQIFQQAKQGSLQKDAPPLFKR
jgi:hypothetical protein